MKPETKLLVVEAIIPEGNEFSIAKLLDLEVFVMGGGQERTEDEFRHLLESAGFMLSKIIPTQESISIIEGVRAGWSLAAIQKDDLRSPLIFVYLCNDSPTLKTLTQYNILII